MAQSTDASLRHYLEARNFRHEPGHDMVQMWQRVKQPLDPLPLPDGMMFADAQSRDPKIPHHLAKRKGEGIAGRLLEQASIVQISISVSKPLTLKSRPIACAGSIQSTGSACSSLCAPRTRVSGRAWTRSYD